MEEILSIHIKSFPHSQCFGVQPDEIVAKIKTYCGPGVAITPAMLVTVCSNALLLAVKDNIRISSEASTYVDDSSKMQPGVGVTKAHMFGAICEVFNDEGEKCT